MLIDKLNWLTSYLSGCTVRDKFNIYCPCCGGTRALKELLKLHIIKSLQYNPIVILTILYFILHIILLFIEYRFYHKYRFIKLFFNCCNKNASCCIIQVSRKYHRNRESQGNYFE